MALVQKSNTENTAAEINQREVSSNQNSATEVNPREESSSQNPLLSLKKKGTNNPGVRVKGTRIYDSENGKTCHQCRQKTRDFEAFCKQLKKGKLCTLTFCHKCFLNRKRKGFQPTGILTHIAKSNGFNSVHELLDNKGAKKLESQSTESKPSFCSKASSSSRRSHDNENQSLKNEAGRNEEGLAKRLKLGTSGVNKVYGNQSHGNVEPNPLEDIILLQGSPLTEVAGTELIAQDVGAALQFLEFCNAFSEVLDIRKGQPECVLRDLTRGCLKHHGVYSAHVEFTIKLLSLTGMDMKKEELRCWIDKVAVQFDEGTKVDKRKLLAAKKKVKDETAKAMLLTREGTPLSLPEYDGFLSQLLADADGVHAEVLAYVELISKKNQRSDAVRTDDVVR